MQSATKKPAATSRDPMVAMYAPLSRVFVTVLAVYYALLVGAHLALLPGTLGQIMAGIAGATAVVGAALRFGPLKAPANLKTVVLATVFFEALVVANVASHGLLAHDQGQMAYLLMMAFAFAMVGPTVGAVTVSLSIVAAAACAMTVLGPPEALVNNIFTSVTAVVGSWAAARWVHGSVRAQAASRADAEALLLDVKRERARAEALAREAEASNRAKSEFLSTMSHELRTPLNGVVGIASALKATGLTPTQTDMADLIESSGRTLARLLGDILDMAKIEAGRIEIEARPFDLRAELERQAGLMFPGGVAKGLDCRLTLTPPGPVWVHGDAVRLQQIIANLVSNAIKFTQAGSVTIHSTWDETTSRFDLVVEDTGVGFDADQASRLFQRFVQADSSISRRFGGTGLGLAICKALCETMGGGIRATGTPNRGARFHMWLSLPRAEAPETAEPASAPSFDAGLLAGDIVDAPLRVLVVEDHATNRKVVDLILSPLGIALTMAEHGAAALDAIARDGPFDVVLMDMQMPVMDGLTATRAIRAEEARTGAAAMPVIMLTANAMAEHKSAAFRAGADLHVAKPVTPAALIGAIEAALDGASERTDLQISPASGLEGSA